MLKILNSKFGQSSNDYFKNYLKKIGSGENTGKSLTREESADALLRMLKAEATPAQIGAFMIAHRIRRPNPQELAGMLDTYLSLGPSIQSNQKRRPIFFGMPFDGRKTTSPIYPLTSLVLISAGQPVVLQGAARMPVKYGITTKELFESIGLNLEGLTLDQVQSGFNENGLAFIYQPDHFPLADTLVNYREEIGKRPPLASMELMWNAHIGEHLHISGYVHTPTEERHWETLKLIGEIDLITIKGMEGGIDIPISRSCKTTHIYKNNINKMILKPSNYNCLSRDSPWKDINQWGKDAFKALNNKGPLIDSLIWNSGIYLWFSGIADDIKEGKKMAEFFIESGTVKKKLSQLISWRSNF